MKIKDSVLILFFGLFFFLSGCADTADTEDEVAADPGAIEVWGPTAYNDPTEIQYTSGTGEYDFGDIGAGSDTASFTIKNTGAGDLTLTTPLTVSVTGPYAGSTSTDSFTITQEPDSPSPIPPSQEAVFEIQFDYIGTHSGSKSAEVEIKSDDPDLTSFTLALTGSTC